MRLWPLVIAIALVVWTASSSASIAAETSSGSLVAGPYQQEPLGNRGTRATYFGVMGEVARPGVYAARSAWTLADLIKRAGGITPQANMSVRIFRGGLLVEQVFLGSGEAPPLLPNDLVVIGARDSLASRVTPAGPSNGPTEQAAVPAVQVAFINLIDRPVIVKMRGDQATLARIVALLEQPADCAGKIRIFTPLGAAKRDSEAADQDSRPLEPGSVLAFPASSIRRESLPALPGPIEEPASLTPAARVQKPLLSKQSDGHPLEPKRGDALPVDSKSVQTPRPIVTAELTVDVKSANRPIPDRASSERSSLMTSDIAPHDESAHPPLPSLPSGGERPSATNAAGFAPSWRSEHNQSHPGRIVAVMAAMSALAGLAMLLTFASILNRWIKSEKLPFRQVSPTASKSSSSIAAPGGVPVAPAPVGLVGRPIRIDAGQPITRLSVDLAVIERAPRSAAAVGD